MATERSDRREHDDRKVRFILDALLAGSAIGLLLGVVNVAYAAWFEIAWMPTLRPGTGPMPTYGQQWAVASFLILVQGMALGLFIAIARRWSLLAASPVPAVAAFVIATFVIRWWQHDYQFYGLTPADWLVFVPPLVVAGICLIITLASAVVGLANRWAAW